MDDTRRKIVVSVRRAVTEIIDERIEVYKDLGELASGEDDEIRYFFG